MLNFTQPSFCSTKSAIATFVTLSTWSSNKADAFGSRLSDDICWKSQDNYQSQYGKTKARFLLQK